MSKTIAKIIEDLNQEIHNVPENERKTKLSGKPALVNKAIYDAFVDSEEAREALSKHHLTAWVDWDYHSSIPEVKLSVQLSDDSPLRTALGDNNGKIERYSLVECKRSRDKNTRDLLVSTVRIGEYSLLRRFEGGTIADCYAAVAYNLVGNAAPFLKSIDVLSGAVKLLGPDMMNRIIIAAKKGERYTSLPPLFHKVDPAERADFKTLNASLSDPATNPYVSYPSIYNKNFTDKAAEARRAYIGSKPNSGYEFKLTNSVAAMEMGGAVQYSKWHSCDELITVETEDSGDSGRSITVSVSSELNYISSIQVAYDASRHPRSVRVNPASAYALSVEEMDDCIRQLVTARYAAEMIQYMFIDNWEITRQKIHQKVKEMETHHE